MGSDRLMREIIIVGVAPLQHAPQFWHAGWLSHRTSDKSVTSSAQASTYERVLDPWVNERGLDPGVNWSWIQRSTRIPRQRSLSRHAQGVSLSGQTCYFVCYSCSPLASHGVTRRGGGASITIIPAEREDCSQDLYSAGLRLSVRF